MTRSNVLLVVGGAVIFAFVAVKTLRPPKQTPGDDALKSVSALPEQSSEGNRILAETGVPPIPAAEVKKPNLVIPQNSQTATAAERRIASYIANGDRNAWTQMRHELLDLSVPREEAVRIAKGYLNHPNPIIRYVASEILYRVGDHSGAQTLIQIVRNPSPIAIAGMESDLRAWAAMTLAEYRDSQGANAVAALYHSTKDRDIRRYAAQLGARQIIPDVLVDMKEHIWKDQLEECALLGVTEAKPMIDQQFKSEFSTIGMRVAAAAAMLCFGEREPYLGYLLEVADRYATDNPVGGDDQLRTAGENAFRSFGRVHVEKVRSFLEQALDSKNFSVEQSALVQLRVQYPESTKARERLIKRLDGQTALDAHTLYRLAAMSNDEEIRREAERRNPLLWQMVDVHEKEWDKDVWLRSYGLK